MPVRLIRSVAFTYGSPYVFSSAQIRTNWPGVLHPPTRTMDSMRTCSFEVPVGNSRFPVVMTCIETNCNIVINILQRYRPCFNLRHFSHSRVFCAAGFSKNGINHLDKASVQGIGNSEYGPAREYTRRCCALRPHDDRLPFRDKNDDRPYRS